jgi:hypothetical protein
MLAACFMLASFLAYSATPKMEATSSKTLLYFNGLHSITFQKMELSITTDVRSLKLYTLLHPSDKIHDDSFTLHGIQGLILFTAGFVTYILLLFNSLSCITVPIAHCSI